MKRLAMPVLEGALERSVELAAAMDSRGYGRTTDASRVARRTTGVLVFGGLAGVCIGVYGLLSGTGRAWMGLPMLLVGSGLGAAGIHFGGRRTGRTTYRPDPWGLPEWLVAGTGVLAAVTMFVNVQTDPASLVLSSVTAVPPVPVLAAVGALLALLPAILAPPLPRPQPAPAQDPTKQKIEVSA